MSAGATESDERQGGRTTIADSKRRVPLVDLGRVVATPQALQRLTANDISSALRRHARGDWGQLSTEDRQANDDALATAARLLSAYLSEGGTRFWVITEADRSVTTVLLAEDY